MLVCSVNRIIESRTDVFEVMKTQPGKNYKSLLDNIKEEDRDVMYKTTKLNKTPGGRRGVDDKHSIEHYKEIKDQKFIQIPSGTQSYLRDRFSDLNTSPLCWLTIFYFKVWSRSFIGDNSMFGFKEIESLAKYYLEHNLFTPEEAEAMPQEWPFLRSCFTHIRTQPIVDVYWDLLLENYEEIHNIIVLIQLMATISPSIAACEHGFSAMNREKTSLRTSLKDDRLEDILQICINGESIEKFDGRRSLEMWLSMAKKHNLRGHRLTGPPGPNKKSNVNNEDELEAQIMDERVPLET